MCHYQNGTYECRGDGYLWDADSDGYDPESFDWPCPACNTHGYLVQAQEDAESCLSGSCNGVSYTGVSLWVRAVAVARTANAIDAQRTLESLAVVRPLIDDDRAAEGFRTELFVYVPCGGTDSTAAPDR